MCLQWGPSNGFPTEARVSGRWLLTLGASALALLWGVRSGVWGGGLLHFRLVHSECHEVLEGLGLQPVPVCQSLGDSLEGARGSCPWLRGSYAEPLELREKRNHGGP